MADGALGILAKAAFRKDRGLHGAGPAIVYPQTPGSADMAATHQIPFISETITEAIERQENKSLLGAGKELPADIIARDFAGSMDTPLSWAGLQRLMFCVMGFESPDTVAGSPNTLATGAYAHLFESDECLQDQGWNATEVGSYTPPSVNDLKVRRGMLGFFKEYPTGGNHVFSSCMINKFTLSGTPSEIKCSWEAIPYGVVKGAYNHANWTLPGSSQAIALFQQAVVKLGSRAGGAGSLTTMAPSEFEITIDNGLEAAIRTTESGEHIIQPVRSGFRTMRMKMGFPRYQTTHESMLNLGVQLDTELAASIEITGPQIAATGENWFWGFFGSSAWMIDPKNPIDGAAAVKTEWNLELARPGSSADIFVAGGKYNGVTLRKNSELVVVTNDDTSANYMIET